MIKLIKNSSSKSLNMLYGIVTLLDGIVRILSFGYMHSTLPYTVVKYQILKTTKRDKDVN